MENVSLVKNFPRVIKATKYVCKMKSLQYSPPDCQPVYIGGKHILSQSATLKLTIKGTYSIINFKRDVIPVK